MIEHVRLFRPFELNVLDIFNVLMYNTAQIAIFNVFSYDAVWL